MDGRTRFEARKRTLLRDVEQALLDALAESREVHRALLNLQRAGFVLRLSVECDERDSDDEAGSPSQPPMPSEPSFRIDAEDLRFLHSVGIDPTRKPRSRRVRR